MQFVYDPRHLLHNPATEVQVGIPLPMFESPARAESIRRALENDNHFDQADPTEHGVEPILAVHEAGLLEYLEHAWSEWRHHVQHAPAIFPDTVLHASLRDGMGDSPPTVSPVGAVGRWCWDTMTGIVQGTYPAARAAVDVALTTADRVLDGERIAYGIARPPGHHAPRGSFGGYCYFNNAAITAEYLVNRSGERVAILDVDYHHGNGTQQIFYRRGDVLYASLHGHPDRAFPYFVGFAEERGAGDGAGATLNIPLPAGCDDATYLENVRTALDAIADFDAQTLVVSLGIDTYGQDPICDFALTTAAYHRVGQLVASLGMPTVILQEGGYYVPHLGENVRQWLRGVLGEPLDLTRLSGSEATG